MRADRHGFVDCLRFQLPIDVRQWPPLGSVGPFAIADERLDDLQRRPRFTLGPTAFEIGGELAVRTHDFLIAHV
jgi:hypothetical protein